MLLKILEVLPRSIFSYLYATEIASVVVALEFDSKLANYLKNNIPSLVLHDNYDQSVIFFLKSLLFNTNALLQLDITVFLDGPLVCYLSNIFNTDSELALQRLDIRSLAEASLEDIVPLFRNISNCAKSSRMKSLKYCYIDMGFQDMESFDEPYIDIIRGSCLSIMEIGGFRPCCTSDCLALLDPEKVWPSVTQLRIESFLFFNDVFSSFFDHSTHFWYLLSGILVSSKYPKLECISFNVDYYENLLALFESILDRCQQREYHYDFVGFNERLTSIVVGAKQFRESDLDEQYYQWNSIISSFSRMGMILFPFLRSLRVDSWIPSTSFIKYLIEPIYPLHSISLVFYSDEDPGLKQFLAAYLERYCSIIECLTISGATLIPTVNFDVVDSISLTYTCPTCTKEPCYRIMSTHYDNDYQRREYDGCCERLFFDDQHRETNNCDYVPFLSQYLSFNRLKSLNIQDLHLAGLLKSKSAFDRLFECCPMLESFSIVLSGRCYQSKCCEIKTFKLYKFQTMVNLLYMSCQYRAIKVFIVVPCCNLFHYLLTKCPLNLPLNYVLQCY